MSERQNLYLARLAYGCFIAAPPAAFVLISLAVWNG